MTVFYNKMKHANVKDKNLPGEWFPVIKSIGKMEEKEVAQRMANEVTLNPKEAEMAIYQYHKILIEGLLEGKTMPLGEMGSFYLTAKCDGVEKPEDVCAKQIRQVNLQFKPSAEFSYQ